MNSVCDLDDELRIHDSVLIRAVCGNPGDESWTRFRKSVLIEGKRRKLSDKEAFLLFVRTYWRRICKEANQSYVKSPAYDDVLRVAEDWIQAVRSHPSTLFNQIISANTFQGTDLPRVMELLTGKARSERTISRACQRAGLKYSRKLRYGKPQTLKIMSCLNP